MAICVLRMIFPLRNPISMQASQAVPRRMLDGAAVSTLSFVEDGFEQVDGPLPEIVCKAVPCLSPPGS